MGGGAEGHPHPACALSHPPQLLGLQLQQSPQQARREAYEEGRLSDAACCTPLPRPAGHCCLGVLSGPGGGGGRGGQRPFRGVLKGLSCAVCRLGLRLPREARLHWRVLHHFRGDAESHRWQQGWCTGRRPGSPPPGKLHSWGGAFLERKQPSAGAGWIWSLSRHEWPSRKKKRSLSPLPH